MHNLTNSPVSSNAALGGVAFATTSPRISADGAEITLGATLSACTPNMTAIYAPTTSPTQAS
jgi:hypothetical protein